jgi:hypothetical protein
MRACLQPAATDGRRNPGNETLNDAKGGDDFIHLFVPPQTKPDLSDVDIKTDYPSQRYEGLT